MTTMNQWMNNIALLSFILISNSQSLSAQKIDNVNFQKIKTVPKGHEKEAFYLLERVVDQIKNHNWTTLLYECDEEHRKFQLENMEMSKENYLAEIMGLHYVDNTISPDDKPITYETLNFIKEVTLTQFAKKSIFENEVFGIVTFSNGWKPLILKLRFHWDETAGRFWLYCSAG